MNIIKLDATASTNTYLKDLLSTTDLINFTVVSTENQYAGKGQRGAVWNAEVGTNLTFSVLVKDCVSTIEEIFCLNIVTALAVKSAIKKMLNVELDIKWPNDILAVNSKLGGILIENIFKADGKIVSIVGIGINVNQTVFNSLNKATSLAKLIGHQLDKDQLLVGVVEQLICYCHRLREGEESQLWEEYLCQLYRKGQPSVFELPSGKRFMGIIEGVSPYGHLEVRCEDDSLFTFGVKEVKLLY
ncbi:biotin--[acetyl-CoA-carboxylase] ligase [Myroides pelagicus]|uniref:Biotin--[acetyl-CoA-carboxylase] ligase n=1 Tax=Myroides pelagicus TaxID=270914 RepID=A0A7K1GMT3_9FLAO|nr:biotin--[acetyl-CoA-carboxylase] ligase [Myroides pelagicus]MEC4114543.1 biotin--[acetyl-CoA-carboxylase] ligase [Myroides pelagicus]MTH30166.1 biotin--[acetyl-CoA-carboxylase] ligase [Myroides pelagicus]